MKEKVNWKTIGISLLIILIGIVLILCDIYCIHTKILVWVSIGCSVLASGLVILLTAILIERQRYDPLADWKIQKIYSTRAARNEEADPNIQKTKYRIDGIIFGLSSFRTRYGNKIEQCLQNGVNIRLLTMDPNGDYITIREQEEVNVPGSIKTTIEELVKWANRLNEKNYTGKIVIKGYICMTLDYYWRVDDEVYIGPYLYGYKSSDTITYKFESGGKGFQYYSEYFESLWNNQNLTIPLTTVQEKKP